MADDALDLRDDGTEVFRSIRDLEIQEFLDGAAIGEVVVHRADIVEPVCMGNKLMIGAIFSQLFDAAVEEAQNRRRFDESFPF
jgi:hypothetical protein